MTNLIILLVIVSSYTLAGTIDEAKNLINSSNVKYKWVADSGNVDFKAEASRRRGKGNRGRRRGGSGLN